MREVFLNPTSGLLSGSVDGKTFIDCSTIDTATSSDVAKAVKEASPTTFFYDAPVSGGTQGAEKGTLWNHTKNKPSDIQTLKRESISEKRARLRIAAGASAQRKTGAGFHVVVIMEMRCDAAQQRGEEAAS